MSDIFENKGAFAATIVVAASDSLKNRSANYVCDGVDDQEEIQAAIDALPATSGDPLNFGAGGEIRLSEGTFHISDTIVVDVANVTITGAGPRATYLVLDDDVNKDVIEYRYTVERGGMNCLLQNLTIDGNGDNQTAGSCLVTTNKKTADFMISHVYIIRAHDFGIHWQSGNSCADSVYVEGCGSTGWYITAAQKSMFTNCSSWGCGGDGFTIKSTSMEGTQFVNCHADGATLAGFSIENTTGKESPVVLSACSAVNCGRESFRLLDCRYVTITGCLAINSSQTADNVYSAIYLWSAHSARGCLHNIITNNHIFSLFEGVTNFPSYGIREGTADGGADYNIIKNNSIDPSDVKTAPLDIHGIHTVAYEEYSDLFMDVLAVTANHIVNGQLLVNGAVAIANQPKYARELDVVITEVGGNVTDYTMTIVGVDAKGNTVTEIFTFADDGLTFECRPLITVTSITLADVADTGNATFNVGIGGKLGLKNLIYETSDVYMITKNYAKQAVAAAQVDVDFDAYDIAAVIGLAATDDFEIWYRSNLNIIA